MQTVLKSALLGIFAMTATISPSFAAEPTSPAETITVTAKSLQEIENLGVAVTIISAEEIKSSNASSIKDVLIQSAGINPGVNSGSISGRQNISIRGTNSDHVLILIDGRKVSGSDAQIGHSDFQYNWVPMNAIERIEVIKGPASSIYGSQAIGGVVNIITKQSDEKFYGDVDVQYGLSEDKDGNSLDTSINIGGKITDKLSLIVSGEHADLDSVADEDNDSDTKIEGKEITNGLIKLRYDLDDTQSIEGTYGQGVEDRYKIEDELYYDIERWNYSLGYNKQFETIALKLDAYVVDTDLYYNSTSSTGGYTHNMTDSVARAEASITAFNRHYIVTGAEYKLEEYDKVYDLSASASRNFKEDIYNTSIFLQDEFEVTPDFLLTVGARYDYHERFKGELSPKINALYKIGAHHRVKAGYGEGFKAPTVTQNSSEYVSTSRHIFYGNDDLEPESSRTFEIGYEYYSDSTVIKTAAYHTEVDDLISSDRIVDNPGPFGDEYLYVNTDKATLQGFECEITKDITQNSKLRLAYHYLDSEDEETGEDLSYRPKHTINARLSSNLPSDVQLTLSANYTGKQYVDDNEYDPFTVYSAQVSKTFFDNMTVRLGIDNITDEDLDSEPYDIKGRLVYAGINYRF